MNLCRNALEAEPYGDDPVVNRRIWVEGERHDRRRLRVCDNRPGVAPAQARAALFPAVPGSARRAERGHGLAIAAEIVRAQATSDWLTGRLRRRFRVRIPDRGGLAGDPPPRRRS
jgi:C4-dicarboxylate-specific signal transduction histidine kinase